MHVYDAMGTHANSGIRKGSPLKRSVNQLNLLGINMAWIHKEENWKRPYYNPPYECYGYREQIWTEMTKDEYDKTGNLSFTDWLDNHCLPDWEVLKISRNFNAPRQDTWVVFRKQA